MTIIAWVLLVNSILAQRLCSVEVLALVCSLHHKEFGEGFIFCSWRRWQTSKMQAGRGFAILQTVAFLVGGVICLVDSVNERNLNLLNS